MTVRQPTTDLRKQTSRRTNNRQRQQSILGSLSMQQIALNGTGTESTTTNNEESDDRDLLPTPIDNIAELRALTNHCADSLMRKNTRDAYKYRILEFRSFCKLVYPHEPVEKQCAVDGNKLYRFLFFQVFRDQSRTKSLKPGEFDINLYHELDTKYTALLRPVNGKKRTGKEILEVMEPKNPLGYSSLITYRAAVRKLYDYQRQRSDGSIAPDRWDSDIMNASIKKLISLVQVSPSSQSQPPPPPPEKTHDIYIYFNLSPGPYPPRCQTKICGKSNGVFTILPLRIGWQD